MLLLSSLQQFDVDPADFFIILGSAGLALFFILAALATPVLGVLTESIYVARRKVFYDKCAMQITQASFCIGLFILLTLAGAAAYLVFHLRPDLAGNALVPSTPENAGLLPQIWSMLGHMSFFILPATGLFLQLLYLLSWGLLKKVRPAHLLLGWASALFMLALLFCALPLVANFQSPLLLVFLLNNPLPVFHSLLIDFFSSPLLPLMFGALLCTGLAAGTGFSQLWLIMRRFKADYGRDYYAFAMRYCARWALIFTLAATLLGCAAFQLLRTLTPVELTQPQDIGIAAIALGLPLCCCLLWLSISKSETPLRHKPGAFFACVFLFIALCAQLLILISTFPMA